MNSPQLARTLGRHRGAIAVGALLAAAFFDGTWRGEPSATASLPHSRDARSVILVLVDGLRWQEVFSGADERLMDKASGGVADVAGLRGKYWRATPEARREALMPFLWSTIARQGQLFGNRGRGSEARVTNPHHFSYPGYSEMIVGYVDPRIDNNDKKPNPNVTVFEWLHKRPGFQGRVAAFGAWDVVPWIVNRERCGFLSTPPSSRSPPAGSARARSF